MARHSASRVHVGVQSVFIISKHTSPVPKWIFGWNILVLKYILGGVMGYYEVRLMRTRKIWWAYGVSLGPWMNAYQAKRSF